MPDNTPIPDDLGTEIDAKDVISVVLIQNTDLIAGKPPNDAPLVSVTFGGIDLMQAMLAATDGTDPRLVVASHDTTNLLMAPGGLMNMASTSLSFLAQIDDERVVGFLGDMRQILEEALA